MSRPIEVWPFRQAPDELQELCNQGGDEDWIVVIPKSIGYDPDDYTSIYIRWLPYIDTCHDPAWIEPDQTSSYHDCVIYVGGH